MAKAVKLADIAERVGVSTVTVSKALSGQKGVSEEVREKSTVLRKNWVISSRQRQEKVRTRRATISAFSSLRDFWINMSPFTGRCISR